MTHGEVALVVIAGCTAVAAWLAFEQLAKPVRRKPRDGRWCPEPGCGGQVSYRRSADYRRSQLVTWVHCWSCGWRAEVGRCPCDPKEPSMTERGATRDEEAKE